MVYLNNRHRNSFDIWSVLWACKADVEGDADVSDEAGELDVAGKAGGRGGQGERGGRRCEQRGKKMHIQLVPCICTHNLKMYTLAIDVYKYKLRSAGPALRSQKRKKIWLHTNY